MNNQLEKQIVLLRDKLEQMKIPSREGAFVAWLISMDGGTRGGGQGGRGRGWWVGVWGLGVRN